MNKTFKNRNFPELQEYINLFVQPLPQFGIKVPGENSWITIHGTLHTGTVMAHINHTRIVSCLSRWYPEHGIIDIDGRPFNEVERIRTVLGFNKDNSMLCTSETAGNYHILFHPEYRGKPPTIRLLSSAMKQKAESFGLELYPQPNHLARLPFGYHQRCVDEGKEVLDGLSAVHWFQKLDPYDIGDIVPEYSYKGFDRSLGQNEKISTYKEGQFLFKNGLAKPSSRNRSQFQVLYYLWRKNTDLQTAMEWTKRWIRIKHNGFSNEVQKGNWRIIDSEISRQAKHIWTKYDRLGVLPDSAHNVQSGYLHKEDLRKILKVSKGNLARMRFLYSLISYAYPRRHYELGIPIHSEKLIKWSSSNSYEHRLIELERAGIIVRTKGYRSGIVSKKIKVKWDFLEQGTPLLIDGRTPNDVKDAIAVFIDEKDAADILKQSNVYSSQRKRILAKIYRFCE